MGASNARCSHPIEPAVLLDYWMHNVDSATADSVEEHLFACDDCGDRLRQIEALIEALRALARSGAVKVVVDSRYSQRALDAGRKVREYAPPPGGSVQCTVSADDDFLLGRLAADLSQAEQVDVAFCTTTGVELQRMVDVPFDARAGAIVYQESITFAKGAPSNTLLVRVLAIEPQGGERLIGDFTFNHTRTIPGPPAWE
jgi:hypothetical protein